MDSLGLSYKIQDCIYFELDDELNEFDLILSSLMETDILQDHIRMALVDWAAGVDAAVLEVEKNRNV
jgi:hypothetical protein|tara:strand:+ start:715 stop:915 length:201 start_codon:yes stop_codon:yes gene_type:complete